MKVNEMEQEINVLKTEEQKIMEEESGSYFSEKDMSVIKKDMPERLQRVNGEREFATNEELV